MATGLFCKKYLWCTKMIINFYTSVRLMDGMDRTTSLFAALWWRQFAICDGSYWIYFHDDTFHVTGDAYEYITDLRSHNGKGKNDY